MRVEWAIPCMGVQIGGGIIERIENAAWDTLTAQILPAALEFVVLVHVVGMREDFSEEAARQMRAELTGPGMDDLLSMEFEVPTGEPAPDHPEGWEVNANIPIVVQFTPEEPGAYMFTLYLNDRWAWSLSFRIVQAGP